MPKKQFVTERELASLAKACRERAGRTRAEAGRELGVSHVSVHRAEENPEVSLLKLRTRMIGLYSPFKVVGPLFRLERK